MRRFAKHFVCFLGMAVAFANAANAQKPDAATDHDKPPLLDVPIPVGQKASGLTFPYREDGKLKMFFNIDEMFRVDWGHLQMTNAKIQTFDDDGKADMMVLLPVSLLDLNTRILTSNQPFLLRRTDFSLVGENLQLNTVTRQGSIKGKVKMIIFNFGDTQKKDAAHE
jgi:hypothetical protein